MRTIVVGLVKDELDPLRCLPSSDGFEVDFIDGTETAWRQILASAPDTVVIQSTMPGNAGFELLARIRGTDKTSCLPVAMIVPSASRSLKEQAIERGATDCLYSPFDDLDLRLRIGALAGRGSQGRKCATRNPVLDKHDPQRLADSFGSEILLIWRLGKTAEARGGASGNHVVRMGYFCRVVARQLNLPQKFIDDIFLAAPLHDIGFLGIPDVILLKGGELTSREAEIVRMHCQIGERILTEECDLHIESDAGSGSFRRGDTTLDMAGNIALSHHEKWDGRGYPHQVSGKQIPLEARIVAICDVFDSMTSSRPFREPYPEGVALEAICSGVEKHFDPEVFQAFMDTLPRIRSLKEQFPDRADNQTEWDQIWDVSDPWTADEWEPIEV